MKRLLKLFPLTLLLCLALALGLTACGEKSYSVTAEYDSTAGSVVLSDEGKNSDGKYQEGTSVTVTVTPNTGYDVASFTVNGTAQTLSGSSYTFTVKEDTKIAVTFGAAFSVTLEKDFDEAAGTASLSAPQNGTKYAKDELVTLTVTANEGYLVEAVTVGGEAVELNEGKYSFKVKADTQVKVTLRAIAHYKVTVGEYDDAMGSVSVTPKADADGKYVENTQLTLAVSVKYGHKLLSVKVNGSDVTLDESGKYSFKIDKDTTVDVSFEELKQYKMTFSFDETMCALAYLGETDDGEEGYLPLSPDTETQIYEGETVFTVTPADGYALNTVTLNGTAVTLSDKSFTLNVGDGIKGSEGKINVVVTCKWVYEQLTALEGEYTLSTGKWFAFTLQAATIYDFSADTYVASAAFYKVEGEISKPKEGKNGDVPVWTFNSKANTNTDIHEFEAGTYLVHMLAESDGVLTTKLTVTKVTALSVTMPEPYLGVWKSTDGHYTLSVGTNYLVLKKDEKFLPATVTTDQRYGDIYVAFEQSEYMLMPYGGFALGTLTFVDGTSGAMAMLFLPATSVTITVPKDIYGTYSGTDEEGTPVDDLTISSSGITLGDKKLTPLTAIDLSGMATPALLSYEDDNKNTHYYVFACQQVGQNAYMIMMMEGTDGTQMMFTLKEPISQNTIDQQYWGTWKCLTANVQFSGYTLVISESGITVTDADGKPVECTVGTYESTAATYPKLTIGTAEYYLRILHGSLYMTLISKETSLSFTFAKQAASGTTGTTPAATATAETSPLAFDDELVGTWQNSELKVTLEKNSVTVADAEGNALSHSLRTETYRGKQYNAVVLGETCYLFLKANGT